METVYMENTDKELEILKIVEKTYEKLWLMDSMKDLLLDLLLYPVVFQYKCHLASRRTYVCSLVVDIYLYVTLVR